jgi:hypothetical protein
VQIREEVIRRQRHAGGIMKMHAVPCSGNSGILCTRLSARQDGCCGEMMYWSAEKSSQQGGLCKSAKKRYAGRGMPAA